MKSIKKVLALVTSTMMLTSSLTLAGCSSKSQQTSSEGSNKDSVTLNIFQFKVEMNKEFKEAAEEYSKEHSNVKINIQTVGGGNDYGAALKAKVQSGEEPAIFNVGGPQDVKDWQSRLVDLSGEPWVKQAIDGALTDVTVDNKIYGLPFDVEGYGFIYNKAIFKDAGIDSSTIKDYASLESAVKTLDSKIKSGELKSKYPKLEAVFEMPAKETWVTGLHTSNAVLNTEFKNCEESFKAKKVEFKNSEALKALIDLQANYSPNSKEKGKLNAVDYATQVGSGIAVERVAIIQQGNWIFNDVKKTDEKVANNLDILPMPIKGGKEDSIPVGEPMYWAVNNKVSQEQQKAAKDFLNWLYTSDKGKDFVVNKFSFVPALKGYEKFPQKTSLNAAVNRYVEAKKTTPWVFMGYPTGWGQKCLGEEIQKYLGGQEKWEDAIKNSQAKWEDSRK